MLSARKKPARSGIDRGGPMRSRKHIQWIRGFCCIGCSSSNMVQAAHIRIGTDGGGSLTPSDPWALPLCFDCHIATQHQKGERTFWRKVGKNPHRLAIEYSQKSPDPTVREFARNMIDRWQP